MSLITFKLIHSESEEEIKSSHILQEIWWYIKTTINLPHNYYVEQVCGDYDIEACINALFLIENYKTASSLPTLLTDILP